MKIKHLLLALWLLSPFIWVFIPTEEVQLTLKFFIKVGHLTTWVMVNVIAFGVYVTENEEEVKQFLNKEITLPKVNIKRKDAFLDQLQKQLKEAIRINDKEERQRLERSIDLLTRN